MSHGRSVKSGWASADTLYSLIRLAIGQLMTTDPVGNIRALEKLIPKNAQVAQAIQTHALKQSMETSEATLLHLIQSINPAIGQNVNVKA